MRRIETQTQAQDNYFRLSGTPEKSVVDIGWRPRRWQREMFSVLAKNRHAVFVIHRRAGKTEGLLHWMVAQGLKYSVDELNRTRPGKPPRYLYFAPNQKQAKEIVGARLNFYQKNITGTTLTYGDRFEMVLPNGVRILVGGMHNPDSARGTYIDICVLDEYAFMNPAAFQSVIYPQLLDYNGRAIFCSTPAGRNEFWRLFQSAQNGELKNYGSLIRTVRDSGVFDKAGQKEIYDHYDGKADLGTYETEFMCNFDAPVPGSYYGELIERVRNEGRVTDVPHDTTRKVLTSWDLGVRDDTAIWFWQIGGGGSVNVIDYVSGSGKSLADWLKIVSEKPYNYEMDIVPHDAGQRDKNSLTSFEMLLAQQGRRPLRLQKESVMTRINAARSILPQCRFDEAKCMRGLESLALYQRQYNDATQAYSDKPLHNWTSHAADAFGYGAICIRNRLGYRDPSSKAARGVMNEKDIDKMLGVDKQPNRHLPRVNW